MFTPLIRRQLAAFGVITAIALTIMGLNYVQIPQMLGIGRYNVTVDLQNSSGLYPKSVVTYRGVEVGTVRSVGIRPGGGAVAKLQIDNGTEIPADAIAHVHSASVIGEQYVDFVPPKVSTTNAILHDGATVPTSRTALPTSTTDLLTAIDDLTTSVPTTDLHTVVDELGKAFANSDDSYGRLIDASSALQKAATANLPATLALIDKLGPVLGTQQALDPSIRTFAKGLDSVTSQLANGDNDVRQILASGSPLAKEAASFTNGLSTVLPSMLNDLAQTGEVLRVYIPGIRHILIVLPALVPAFNTATPLSRLDDDFTTANLYFKLGLDPPPCTTGFADAYKQRSPSDLSTAPIPQNSYCKAGKTSQLVVRGARNDPCPHDPARRSATAAGCGYIFDPATVAHFNLQPKTNNGSPDLAGDSAASLIAPNGQFFLFDPAMNSRGITTWKQLLMASTGSK